MSQSKTKKDFCFHDYKNAIEVGKIDHMCPKCFQIIDPFEWFLCSNYNVVDSMSTKRKKELLKLDKETSRKAALKYKIENKSNKILE